MRILAGFDPLTGDLLPENSPWKNKDIYDALRTLTENSNAQIDYSDQDCDDDDCFFSFLRTFVYELAENYDVSCRWLSFRHTNFT